MMRSNKHLICIFMNINANIRNEETMIQQLRHVVTIIQYFYYMLGGNLGPLLYGDVSVMVNLKMNRIMFFLIVTVISNYINIT